MEIPIGQVREAFYRTFVAMGELWFPGEEHCSPDEKPDEYVTPYWEDFLAVLREIRSGEQDG